MDAVLKLPRKWLHEWQSGKTIMHGMTILQHIWLVYSKRIRLIYSCTLMHLQYMWFINTPAARCTCRLQHMIHIHIEYMIHIHWPYNTLAVCDLFFLRFKSILVSSCACSTIIHILRSHTIKLHIIVHYTNLYDVLGITHSVEVFCSSLLISITPLSRRTLSKQHSPYLFKHLSTKSNTA